MAARQNGSLTSCYPPVPDCPSTLWTTWFRRLLMIASWGLLAVALTQWILIRLLGDVWWLGTIALFAPRWPLLAPVAVVAVACAVWRPRLLWLHLASGLVVMGPVMGFCMPQLPLGGAVKDGGATLRVMTVNLGGGADLDLLRAQIDAAKPDVIAFQEFGTTVPEDLAGKGWHWEVAGGTAVASRYPIETSDRFSARQVGRWGDAALRVRLALPFGPVWVHSLHLNTPRDGLEGLAVTRRGLLGVDALRRNINSRGVESHTIRRWVGTPAAPTIVAGDLNMPVESLFYRRDWSQYQNAFSTAGFGYGHTKSTQWHGVRIDHVLADGNWQVRSCRVVDAIGGDHRPVVAELALRK
jgi:endonuclease/exonuclease/phosphatase family metal-dependent hydrolase